MQDAVAALTTVRDTQRPQHEVIEQTNTHLLSCYIHYADVSGGSASTFQRVTPEVADSQTSERPGRTICAPSTDKTALHREHIVPELVAVYRQEGLGVISGRF